MVAILSPPLRLAQSEVIWQESGQLAPVDATRLAGEPGVEPCAPSYTPCGGQHAREPRCLPLECFGSHASVSKATPSFSPCYQEGHRRNYRGRLAPSPTGLLHVGHARTFWIAAQRAIENQGTLILRNEDLDPQRSRAEFARAMMEDLRWLGIGWTEGPDCGGPYGSYSQSERRAHYLEAWRRLREGGFLYPCTCSRKDLAQAASAPNDGDDDDEPVYPGTCRERKDMGEFTEPAGVNWRFRVPEGERIEFTDLNLGRQRFVAGRDFGDFL